MHFPPHIVLICVYLIFCRGEETKGKCQVIWGHEWWLYMERRSRSRKGIKSFLPFESRPLLPLFVVCCKQYHLDGRSVIIYTFLCGNINGHINYLGRPEPSPLHSTNALLPQSSPDSPVHSFPGLFHAVCRRMNHNYNNHYHYQTRPNWCPVHVRRGWCLRGGVYEVGRYKAE